MVELVYTSGCGPVPGRACPFESGRGHLEAQFEPASQEMKHREAVFFRHLSKPLRCSVTALFRSEWLLITGPDPREPTGLGAAERGAETTTYVQGGT